MTGSDISAAEVARANREAVARGLTCNFRVDDMRTLGSAEVGKYGAVIALDNALPHLDNDDDIVATFSAIRTRLLPGGKAIISIRDYDRHLKERPTSMPAIFYGDRGSRRIVFQIWDWLDERRYVVHQHIDNETPQGWITHHFVGQYRAVTTDELLRLADQAGFQRVCVLPSSNTGFYQPIIVAEVG